MFVFEASGERVIVVMTAGNLSVTQTAIAKLRQEIAREGSPSSIMHAGSMLEVAEIVGRTLNDVYVAIGERMERTRYSASASMLVGGQRLGGQMRLFLIYREGNFIEATDDTPFLQIGEHKYGKPILDRVVRPSTSLEDGRKAVLISMDSTLRSNLSVGMPLDLLTIRRNEYRVAYARADRGGRRGPSPRCRRPGARRCATASRACRDECARADGGAGVVVLKRAC